MLPSCVSIMGNKAHWSLFPTKDKSQMLLGVKGHNPLSFAAVLMAAVSEERSSGNSTGIAALLQADSKVSRILKATQNASLLERLQSDPPDQSVPGNEQ